MACRCEDLCFFFFQAEDGIRDRDVTGVQTCALPISRKEPEHKGNAGAACGAAGNWRRRECPRWRNDRAGRGGRRRGGRSEERRVGKECRSRGWEAQQKKNHGAVLGRVWRGTRLAAAG